MFSSRVVAWAQSWAELSCLLVSSEFYSVVSHLKTVVLVVVRSFACCMIHAWKYSSARNNCYRQSLRCIVHVITTLQWQQLCRPWKTHRRFIVRDEAADERKEERLLLKAKRTQRNVQLENKQIIRCRLYSYRGGEVTEWQRLFTWSWWVF